MGAFCFDKVRNGWYSKYVRFVVGCFVSVRFFLDLFISFVRWDVNIHSVLIKVVDVSLI